MMHSKFRTAALALAVPGLALATPTFAAPAYHAAPAAHAAAYGDLSYDHGRKHHRRWDKHRGRHHRYDGRRAYNSYQSRGGYYGEPVYANTRVWRGDDNRYYCRRSDGTTGLLIGGAAGALLGREIAGRGDRTLGAILGGAAGALLGREIDRGGSRCR